MTEMMFENLEVQQQEEVPSLKDFRQAVDTLRNPRESAIIKLVYLGAFRSSEVCCKTTPWELRNNKTKPYGQTLSCSFGEFEINGKMEKILLLKGLVAKRYRKPKKEGDKARAVFKTIALPCNPDYEPWTLDLLKFIQQQAKEHKKDPEWTWHKGLQLDMVRMTLQNIVKRNLKRLFPKIHVHSLRHFRCTHLILAYDFNPFQLACFAGWTLKTGFSGLGISSSSMLDTYTHIRWKDYIKKLFKPITQLTN